MAICEWAIQKPIYEADPIYAPTQLILHTAVSGASSLYGWFSSPAAGGLCSHMYNPENGMMEQYVNTEIEAYAEFEANAHAISVESWDGGDPETIPWTGSQIASFIRFALWCRDTHGIPMVLCSGPDAPGIGYHQQFPEWNLDSHDCPGALRVSQLINVILPALNSPVIVQENEMNQAPEPGGRLEMVAARNGACGHWWQVTAGTWDGHGYGTFPPPPGKKIAAAGIAPEAPDGHLEIIVTCTDGSMFHQWFQNNSWTGWRPF